MLLEDKMDAYVKHHINNYLAILVGSSMCLKRITSPEYHNSLNTITIICCDSIAAKITSYLEKNVPFKK